MALHLTILKYRFGDRKLIDLPLLLTLCDRCSISVKRTLPICVAVVQCGPGRWPSRSGCSVRPRTGGVRGVGVLPDVPGRVQPGVGVDCRYGFRPPYGSRGHPLVTLRGCEEMAGRGCASLPARQTAHPAHDAFCCQGVTTPWPPAGGNWAAGRETRPAGSRPPRSVAEETAGDPWLLVRCRHRVGSARHR
jgi:hypothetical protein